MHSPFGSPLIIAYGLGTPADMVVCPESYKYMIDVPGINACKAEVHLEHGKHVLLVSCERKRYEVKEGEKYARTDRQIGKLTQKFLLPEDASTDGIKDMVYDDGVLIVTVERINEAENMVDNV